MILSGYPSDIKRVVLGAIAVVGGLISAFLSGSDDEEWTYLS
jgi:hypothetical protein